MMGLFLGLEIKAQARPPGLRQRPKTTIKRRNQKRKLRFAIVEAIPNEGRNRNSCSKDIFEMKFRKKEPENGEREMKEIKREKLNGARGW